MGRANSVRTLEEGSRRRSSGGGTTKETTRFLRGTRRMSKDGSRRDQGPRSARTRTAQQGPQGGVLPYLVMAGLVVFAYLVATQVSGVVARLFTSGTD